jgi:hypothetical protein
MPAIPAAADAVKLRKRAKSAAAVAAAPTADGLPVSGGAPAPVGRRGRGKAETKAQMPDAIKAKEEIVEQV